MVRGQTLPQAVNTNVARSIMHFNTVSFAVTSLAKMVCDHRAETSMYTAMGLQALVYRICCQGKQPVIIKQYNSIFFAVIASLLLLALRRSLAVVEE